MRLRDGIYAGILATLSLVGGGQARNAPSFRAPRNVEPKANAVARGLRPGETTSNLSGTCYTPSILTYVTPSPGATPVSVTKESQLVTSYVPEFTLCELSPIAEVSIYPPSLTIPSNAPYPNNTVSIPTGTGKCTTILSPIVTMVCATTLTALDKQYTVTDCDQEITFASQYGYSIISPTSLRRVGNYSNTGATITPAPSIVTLTTFMVAPWQQLTAGTAPSDVELKICKQSAVNVTECILEQQIWETSLVTATATSFTTVNISTTIHGSSQILVESFTANITEYVTTFSMSTTMALEYETEFTITNSANKTVVSTVPTSSIVPATSKNVPTHTDTYTLENASANSTTPSGATATSSGGTPSTTQTTDSLSMDGTTTSTIHVTSTTHVGTITVTVTS